MLLDPPALPESVGLQKRLTEIRIDDWLKNDVFHFRWWILIALIIISLTAWFILLDKPRLKETCLYAILATIFVLCVVEYGDELTLWDYPTDVIPIFPPLTSINLFILPLVYSLLFQGFRTKRSFFLATVAATAVICFLIEPVLSWGRFFQLVKWSYFYNFVTYISVAMFTKYLASKIIHIAELHLQPSGDPQEYKRR